MALDTTGELERRLGKVPKTPDFVQMIDDIETIETTPRSEFWKLISTLQTHDWLMAQSILSSALFENNRLP